MSFAVELLAGIPSVVIGLWALFVLTPLMRDNVEPFLNHTLGFLPIFHTKPFSLRELFARMTAVLRRSEQRDVRPEVEEERLGPLRSDRAGRRAMIDDAELRLTPKDWELLAYLVHRRGRVFTREILLEQV